MPPVQPNILLIMPDQMRGDCLSIENHPCLLTPNLDQVASGGTHFRRGYSTCASCIPARRSLLTGQFPSSNGMVGFENGLPIEVPTLPQCLRDGGYHTVLVGRHMHQYPHDEPYGYEETIYGSTYIRGEEYEKQLEEAFPGSGGIRGHGLSFNGWNARPWQLPDAWHPTTWISNRSQEVLRNHQEEEKPIFITASFYAPHPPLLPPKFYMERYLRSDLPPRSLGEWASPPEGKQPLESHYVDLHGEALKSAQAGYFGLINHIDDQLFWLIKEFKDCSAANKRPWIIVVTSDHGEMLGDHYMFRKCEPYDGSSRVPFLIQASPDLCLKDGQSSSRPVCLEDLMPTLLEMAYVDVPETVEGASLVPILKGEDDEVRPWLHCEHAPCYSREQAYHMLTDGHFKYIWRAYDGSEQLFDLDKDPGEVTDLAGYPASQKALAMWRGRLVEELRYRPEGFVDGDELVSGVAYPAIMSTHRK